MTASNELAQLGGETTKNDPTLITTGAAHAPEIPGGAPRCFGSPTAHRPNGRECVGCPYRDPCGERAAIRLREIRRELLGDLLDADGRLSCEGRNKSKSPRGRQPKRRHARLDCSSLVRLSEQSLKERGSP